VKWEEHEVRALPSTLGGLAANQIGAAYRGGEIDPITHKLLHGVSGAVQGVILSSDPLSGAAAGATGAIVAETTAMNLPSSLAPRTRANIGRIAAGVTTLVTNQDVNTAITTATTAVENNWLHPAPTLEIEKNRQEIEDAGTEALGEVLGTEIPPLAHHQQTAFNQAKTFFEEANQALQTPNLSSWGRMALLRQRNAALEFMGQAQTLPTTVGDATLIGAGLVGGSMGQASQFAKEGVKFFKLGQQWGKGLRQATRLAPIPEEISVFTKQRPVHLSRNLEGLDLKATPIKPTIVDYSTSEAAYSLRIDPITYKGPMSVDSQAFTKADSYTKLGAPRNQEQFWQLWEKKHPGMLSIKNLRRIQEGRAPHVDEHWLKYFPEHQNYMGQVLEHHHIDHGFLTTPLPEKLHRGFGNSSVWHNQ